MDLQEEIKIKIQNMRSIDLYREKHKLMEIKRKRKKSNNAFPEQSLLDYVSEIIGERHKTDPPYKTLISPEFILEKFYEAIKVVDGIYSKRLADLEKVLLMGNVELFNRIEKRIETLENCFSKKNKKRKLEEIETSDEETSDEVWTFL